MAKAFTRQMDAVIKAPFIFTHNQSYLLLRALFLYSSPFFSASCIQLFSRLCLSISRSLSLFLHSFIAQACFLEVGDSVDKDNEAGRDGRLFGLGSMSLGLGMGGLSGLFKSMGFGGRMRLTCNLRNFYNHTTGKFNFVYKNPICFYLAATGFAKIPCFYVFFFVSSNIYRYPMRFQIGSIPISYLFPRSSLSRIMEVLL